MATLFLCRLVLCLTIKSKVILGKLTSLCVPYMVSIHWWAFCNYWTSTTNTRRPPKGVLSSRIVKTFTQCILSDLVSVACPEQWWLRTGGLMAAKKESSHSLTRAAPPSSCGSSDWLSTLSASTILHNKPDLLTLWLAVTLSHVSQCNAPGTHLFHHFRKSINKWQSVVTR